MSRDTSIPGPAPLWPPILAALPAVPPAGGAAATEEVPGNVVALMVQNFDPISGAIVLLSFVAIGLILQAFLRARRSVLLPDASTAEIERMIAERQYKELLEFTAVDASFVSDSLHPALRRAPQFAAMKEAMENAVDERTAEEFRKLEMINVLANVGPLLGLLGTVLGIMQAFLTMQQAGGAADPASLAGGISTALGTTLLGLMLAIPCLLAYGYLRTRVDRLTSEGATRAEEYLLAMRAETPGRAESPARQETPARGEASIRGESRNHSTPPRPARPSGPPAKS